MKIAIAGMGYVGLSQAVLLAQHNSVCVVDVAAEKVDMLNRGISPIQDSYLDAYLNKAASAASGHSGPGGWLFRG